MKKRGQVFQVVIFAAIALVVLVVVILIFRGQIGKGAKGFEEITEHTRESISGERCQALFMDRKCLSEPRPKWASDWEEIPGEWSDCKGDQKCYEKIP